MGGGRSRNVRCGGGRRRRRTEIVDGVSAAAAPARLEVAAARSEASACGYAAGQQRQWGQTVMAQTGQKRRTVELRPQRQIVAARSAAVSDCTTGRTGGC